MKTKQILFVLLVFTSFAISCNNDDEEFTPFLKAVDLNSNLVVSEQARDTFVTLSSNVAWTATADTWITLKKASGIAAENYKLEFSVTANPDLTNRSGKIEILAPEYPSTKLTIQVTQEGVKLIPSIVVSDPADKTLSLESPEAGEHKFSVTSNVAWNVSTETSWITLQTTSGTGDGEVTFNVTANTDPQSDNTGSITISYTQDATVKDMLTVVQPKAVNYRERDSLAMLAILENITFNNPGYKNAWKADKPLDQWTFVTVENGRVTAIDFLGQVDGTLTLPAEIGNLTELKTLNLSYFGASGVFPDISKLTKLEVLQLDNNKFEGEFPAYLANFPLTTFTLNKNKFTGCVPAALSAFIGDINPQQGATWRDQYNLEICQ